ncbi:MAG: carbohydrate-binding domain-containing protein [Pirellulaceae bacterium]
MEIAGEIVATFNVGDYGAVIGDYAARNFVEMSFTSLVPVVASDVRINFINDTYDPANGIDYNVRVDRLKSARRVRNRSSSVCSLPEPGFP